MERELKMMKMADKMNSSMFFASDILVLKDIDSVIVILFILKISRFQARTAWDPLLAARFLHKCKKVTIVNKVRTIFIFQISASFGVYLKEIFAMSTGYRSK